MILGPGELRAIGFSTTKVSIKYESSTLNGNRNTMLHSLQESFLKILNFSFKVVLDLHLWSKPRAWPWDQESIQGIDPGKFHIKFNPSVDKTMSKRTSHKNLNCFSLFVFRLIYTSTQEQMYQCPFNPNSPGQPVSHRNIKTHHFSQTAVQSLP